MIEKPLRAIQLAGFWTIASLAPHLEFKGEAPPLFAGLTMGRGRLKKF